MNRYHLIAAYGICFVTSQAFCSEESKKENAFKQEIDQKKDLLRIVSPKRRNQPNHKKTYHAAFDKARSESSSNIPDLPESIKVRLSLHCK